MMNEGVSMTSRRERGMFAGIIKKFGMVGLHSSYQTSPSCSLSARQNKKHVSTIRLLRTNGAGENCGERSISEVRNL